MPVLAFALALTETVAPAGGPFQDYYRPIWDDIRLSGTSGNNNALMDAAWVNGREGEDVSLHMDAIDCRRTGFESRCVFSVRRDSTMSAPASQTAAPALAALLHCQADFSLDEEGEWYVVHTTRRGVAHAMTSMQCRTEGAYAL